KLGLPWSVASKMKPWALMGSLGLPACEMARKRAQKPVVDARLGQLAKEQGKQIVALETMIGQLKAMDSLPEEVALKGLVQSASLGTRLDDLFETMIQLYLEEKTALIWSLMRRVAVEGFVPAQENAEYAAFQREIVDRRNVTMTQEAEKLIEQGKVFIAVGALHLPGEQGMLNILAQKGYRISRVTP
ncbi:MAG: TraB/GumN family protein, partial [Rhizobiaceae bacterium]